MIKIVLASKSPRRSELLHQMGLEFEILPSNLPEQITKEKPEEIVMELSLQKAREVAEKCQEALIIGADTIVVCYGEIMGKPKNETEAMAMLEKLSGHQHQVLTGVTLIKNQTEEVTFFEETKVNVAKLSKEEISAYVATKDCLDKAGAYGIQGEFAKFITGIEGDYNNVVGFPIARTYQELKKMGIL
ncbi:MAG: septum formation inhibitor Maf [Lachnospiraceae bacterium]|nr:septum formation inhibitor Maf [Lachnospiraceae bacterium]